MTLATDIYITGTGVTHREVFDKVNEILGIPEERITREGPAQYRWDPGNYAISNAIGQGFPAIVRSHANQDGSLIVQGHDDDCEDSCSSHSCTESFHVHVDLDTGYGYRDDRGWDCSRLHAYVILSLAEWLKDKQCTVRWTNEYAGTVHDADDREAFKKFIGSGDDAAAWFFGAVLPAIAQDIANE
jgi:hypothetical protein